MLLEVTSMPINPTRVAAYARVSTNGQTVEKQLHELQEAPGRHRWEVFSIFTDEGISGTKGPALAG
jgi:DNA invertase Pin-like site-specific DNA recombinase